MAASVINKGPKSDKVITDALRLAMQREATDSNGQLTRRIVLLAESVAELALRGERWAVELVWDRLEGRAPETVTLNGAVSHELGVDAMAILLGRIDAISGRLPPVIEGDAVLVNGTDTASPDEGNGNDINGLDDKPSE